MSRRSVAAAAKSNFTVPPSITDDDDSSSYSPRGVAGTIFGASIIGNGPIAPGTMFAAACSGGQEDESLFCMGMKFAVMVQAFLYIVVAMLMFYGLVEFMRGGGLARISKFARGGGDLRS